ncbi:MAG: WYL domain-containing protein, partial [Gallionella sp.]
DENVVHGLLRKACEQRKKIAVAYQDSEGKSSERILWPLGMIGWGDRWTLLAWCEKRVAYRNFRFDRIQDITVLAERYPLHPQRNLEHYLTQIEGMKDEQKPV